MICNIREREILIKPCKHLIICNLCSHSLDSCSFCQQRIEERIRLDRCIKCRVRTSSKIYEPCGHVNACRECAPGFRSCPECRLAIERVLSIEKYSLTDINGEKDDKKNENYIKTAQKSLIKERVFQNFIL